MPSDNPNAVLMCRTYPRSDITLSLPTDYNTILFNAIPRQEAIIEQLEIIADNTVHLKLQLQQDANGNIAATFEPGQFMTIEIPNTNDRRTYSLANTSNSDGKLEFLIRLQIKGIGSDFFRQQAQVGTKLVLHGPQGNFKLDANSSHPRWFVAGGTGIAPILSMLRHAAEMQDMQAAHLFFGVNRENELFGSDILQDLQAQLPQLQMTVCVWKPQNDWRGFIGTPADAFQQALAQTNIQPDVYLCGPPLLLDAAEKIALTAGIPQTQIFVERFLPSG
jgi:ferredoxin-NADP reductase